MHTIRQRFGSLISGLLTVACATTGDPRQGGLFAWSEEKAIARQEQLRQDNLRAQGQLALERQRMADLAGRRLDLATESAGLEAEVTSLLDENSALDTQLRTLVQRRQLKQGEAVRLQKLLAENERLRATARTAAIRQAPRAPNQAKAINEQNTRLHREVMILLQR